MLFSFQMCAKILESASKINMDEYNFFLRGGVVSKLKKAIKRKIKIYFSKTHSKIKVFECTNKMN